MADFLYDNNLNDKIEKIFEDANSVIIIISPYIHLHERFQRILKSKNDNPGLHITIVFGKNEDDFSKSLQLDDFNFLKTLPNIEIRYEKRLHAKYYANEYGAIITSMNLYSYSQNNNLEVGVYMENGNFIKRNTLDDKAYNYFQNVINRSELLFKNEPKNESSLLGLKSKYGPSEIKIDILSDRYKGQFHKENTFMGFCIRTGKPIPFNVKKPMCEEAYKNWSIYKNEDYKEKYCHKTGVESKGKTSMRNPIL